MTQPSSFYSNEDVRPYEGLDDIEDSISEMEIYVRSRNAWTSNSEVTYREDDAERPEFRARIDLSSASTRDLLKSAIRKTGFEVKEVALCGLVRSKTTKGMRAFFQEDMDSIISKGGIFEIPIPLTEYPTIAKDSTLQIEFYLITTVGKPKNLPKPTSKGTWLAQKQFLLKGQQQGSLRFRPEDLTEEIRKEKNLGKYSVIYVENIYPMHTVPTISESINVYIDEEVHEFLRTTQNKVIREYFWADIVAKSLTSALQFSLSTLKQSSQSFEELERTTAFGALIRSLANSGSKADRKLDADDIFDELVNKPELAAEYLEDRVRLSKKILEFAEERE